MTSVMNGRDCDSCPVCYDFRIVKRRRLLARWLMPAWLLVILPQIGLPSAALRMTAAMADPLGHATICVVAPGETAATTAPDDAPAPAGMVHCAACPIGLAAPMLPGIEAASIPAPVAAVALPPSDPAPGLGPRGPPHPRPPARAPPLSA